MAGGIHYATDDEALRAVKTNGRNLQNVPMECRSQELCQEAVKQTGWALEHVPSLWKDEALCLQAVTLAGYALMFVPFQFKTVAVCKAALMEDADSSAYIPEEKKWISSAMEGYLLTVHCHCESWQVEVTDISGISLVIVQAAPQELLSNLFRRLETELHHMGCTCPIIFMFANGRLRSEMKNDDLVGDVMAQAEMSSEAPSGFFV